MNNRQEEDLQHKPNTVSCNTDETLKPSRRSEPKGSWEVLRKTEVNRKLQINQESMLLRRVNPFFVF